MNVQTEKKVQISEARKATYPALLDALQHMRTNKALTDAQLHPLLDKAHAEVCKYSNEAIVMFKRVLLHIGDVSRQHHILKRAGIKSSKGGAGERINFRSIMRWWESRMMNDFYSNLEVFAQFTVLENLLFDQIRTIRKTGKVVRQEKMGFDTKIIASYFAEKIRKEKNPLIARHLPKYPTGKFRYSLNRKGERYRRGKQEVTLLREKRIRGFVQELCDILGWSVADYRRYRSRQNTPEQLFSSKKILELPESDLFALFDRMTASQRFRVAHMLIEKDKFGHMKVKEKWQKAGEAYVKWESAQTKLAEKIRNEDDEQKKEALSKDFKVKATGLQTIDLLAKIAEGRDTDDQINNTYQALIEKMDLVGNVFPVIDGSSSMSQSIASGWVPFGKKSEPVDSRYGHLRFFDVATAMAIAFSTRNPNPVYRNTFGWFSDDFVVVGTSKYRNTAPNPYVKDIRYIERADGGEIISEKFPFLKNLQRIRECNPGLVACTNIGAGIEYFVKLKEQTGMHVEDLPGALLFITDNEGNTGMAPDEFMAHAAKAGWFPLVIFWGIKYNDMSQYKRVPNCLFIGGFNEGVLSQVLRGIKSGSIVPETELWSINDDERYSVLT